MTQREHESLTDHDPHTFLFGSDEGVDGIEHGEHGDHGTAHHDRPQPAASTRSSRRHERAEHHHRHRVRRNRRVLGVLAVVIAALVAVSAWLIVPKVIDVFSPPDYAGSGSGSVAVTVHQGDTAADIGATLKAAGVVESTKAFTNAASSNAASQNIQPGTYVLHRHMSAASALALLLDPSSRSSQGQVVVTEGATTFDIAQRMITALGAAQTQAIRQAIAAAAELGIPLGYTAGGKAPSSVEGFLYPATYTFDPNSSPVSDLQKMTSSFAEHDRTTGFAAAAQKLKLTPYQALIVASIAQSEARFPADMAKVARVILNRIAAQRPLQIDATSAYAAKLQGLDPTKIVFSQVDSPYNSYTHAGLPPTPISNPGADALSAAVSPADGNWLYYVNQDAAGHLFFTNDEAAFTAAVATCRANNWGCG